MLFENNVKLTIIQRIPPHLLAAGSAWSSRVIIAITQLLSVRILMKSIGAEQYAIFAIMTGLAGWYFLADMGLGNSVQNYISECRAKEQSYDNYLKTMQVIVIIILLIEIILIYSTSPYIAPILLKKFMFMCNATKIKIFFTVSILYIGNGIGNIITRVWYAQQKGYLSNIILSIGSLIGLGSTYLIANSNLANKLYLSLIVFIAPTTILLLFALFYRFWDHFNFSIKVNFKVLTNLVSRAYCFWLFSIMSAFVLMLDYIIMSQFLLAKEIVIYHITTKIYGFLFFFYNAFLQALWPVFTEKITANNWQTVIKYLKKYITLGISMMVFSTIFLIYFMPHFIRMLSPKEHLMVPILFITLVGIYQIVRVWADTFAMVLGSMSDLRPFWISIPLQAIFNLALQWILTPIYGIYGIILGLIISFILTVVWTLPFAVHQHIKSSRSNVCHEY